MPTYVALLRAVNVGGTGKLPMTELKALCEEAGFQDVRTYIASGNVIFRSPSGEKAVRSALEERLLTHMGKPVQVCIRTASEMADILKRNPFSNEPGNRVAVLFTDAPLPSDPAAGVTGQKTEQLALGKRELFIFYPDGMGTSRLRLPAEKTGTARNINTVAKLAEMAAAL
ncbi:hypothetical protein TSACC_3639 [Terrimicrobium sacchariphilum]|uniref:DUF1697 domain-containing protein n=1 Tax=Terrimicrobium sacchariphilum TaxID=690879 RepID=A0A146GGK0_TERSA|nr:DUF1697 domain-containing protein [Terrimicrobium sacchariphilum]GAT35568.1 hypothetical protein TSACC_3639 [Terrimicrobium sacchariphilum]